MATVWVLVSSTLFELFERGVRKEGKGGPDLKLVVDSTAGSLKAFEGTMFVCGKQPHPSHTMETILFRQRKCQITEREREHVPPRAMRKSPPAPFSGLRSFRTGAAE